MAKEATFGVPLTPTGALPFTGNAINTDPGLFYPEVMTGTRDLQTFALYGQRKHVGAVDAPLFPSNGVLFLISAIGADGSPGYGVAGLATGTSTTSSAAVTAGATTITVASATGIVANTTIIQIDINVLTPSVTTSECRLVTAVAGTTLTLDTPLVYAHAGAVPVSLVTAPFTHLLNPQTYLPSITVEKNLGGPSSLGGQSLQYAGCRIGKFDMKGQATDTEASFTADMTAQSVTLLTTPSTISFLDESPFAFSTYTLTYNGTVYKNPTNFTMTVDNGLKPTWTMNGSQDLQFNPAVALHVSGQFDMVYDLLNDATYGMWNKMYTETEASLSFEMQNAQGSSITFTMPHVNLKGDTIDPKTSDPIMETVTYEVRRSLSLSPSSITGTLVNGAHAAY